MTRTNYRIRSNLSSLCLNLDAKLDNVIWIWAGTYFETQNEITNIMDSVWKLSILKFLQIPFPFIGQKLFWASPENFGLEKIGEKADFSSEKSIFALSKTIWT